MKPIRSQKQLIEFMEQHPEYYLEWCLGARDDWYWLNNGKSSGQWFTVAANAANAAIRANKVKQVQQTWKSRRYVLVPTTEQVKEGYDEMRLHS